MDTRHQSLTSAEHRSCAVLTAGRRLHVGKWRARETMHALRPCRCIRHVHIPRLIHHTASKGRHQHAGAEGHTCQLGTLFEASVICQGVIELGSQICTALLYQVHHLSGHNVCSILQGRSSIHTSCQLGALYIHSRRSLRRLEGFPPAGCGVHT